MHTHTHACTHTFVKYIIVISQYIAPSHLPRVYLDLAVNPTHREVLNNAFVFVHLTLHQANAKLAKRGGHTMTITPRHYLDFINHYVSIDYVLVRKLN